MRAGRRTVLGSSNLQMVLARLFRGHVELVRCRPMLDPRHRGAGSEGVMHWFTPESDFDGHVTAAMQVHLGACADAERADHQMAFEGCLLVLHEDQRVGLTAVLPDEKRLDDRHGLARLYLDVLDFPYAVALVEDVDGFHFGFLLGSELRRDA